MATDRPFLFTPNVVVGSGIMLFGVALLLDRMGLMEVRALLPWWPVLLIVFGAAIVAQALRAQTTTSGSEQPLITPGLVIVAVIVFVVASHVQRRHERAEQRPGAHVVTLFAVMGADDLTNAGRPFHGAEITSVMGRARLDLRQAELAPGEVAVVDMFSLMGRTVIQVPAGWTVDVDAVRTLAGVRDSRQRTATRSEPAADAPVELEPEGAIEGRAPPRLVLRGFMMMGGLTIES